MNDREHSEREPESRSDRLSLLCNMTLRINESLDVEHVLRAVVNGSLELTRARFGVITTHGDEDQPEYFFTAGMTPEERELLESTPGSEAFYEYLGQLREPLRVADFGRHASSVGLPDFHPLTVGALLAMPIRQYGQNIGFVCLSKAKQEGTFSQEDEETLLMFSAQAALVISNARRYREEHRTRADLEALIDTSPIGVAVFDALSGRPVSFNREAVRILGKLREPDTAPEELLEVVTVRRADGRELSLTQFPIAEALALGETVRAEEILIQVPDGPSVATLINATPIFSDDGSKVSSVVVTLQDMTPLQELERLRGEFLAMVSHELRTPLAAIKGSTATLLQAGTELDNAEVRQFHRIIDAQADQMREQISDLLDVAHIETGSLSVEPEPSDLSALADQARNGFLHGGGRHAIQIDLRPNLPPVLADRRRIVQVLANLLDNAARHSQATSVIRVTAEIDDVYVAVSVIDQGRGIAANRMPHLFEKYPRSADDALLGGPEGSGLGLAICRGIVEAHGGRIQAESDGPGQGSRFTFTLPTADRVAAAPPRTSGPANSDARQPGEQARILAVDDDPQALRRIRDTLSRAGHTPIVATDAEDALKLVETHMPQLALLDLVLPGVDGVKLMQQIREVAEMPVIFVSAYGRDENIERAFEMGADDYLVKPTRRTSC